ncbi:hypothetical protein FGE12_16530 [Aggregicoccus sp. 17bor-14]|uniref:hypothetical protein n=1 Tax=Myxococcaceae TaxID=31 RepID=UPI00129D1085|nr:MULTISPECIES: hypothetical protein [Myxococcaceae]MBF5044006.1 hypothetical protein [Simulacricoccus sp. 17bor-14]MRI89757.1 hypothetical protein [Aggregicoccus sp. 17bor-14]
MNADTQQQQRAELERLQAGLASRKSIRHYAHAAVSTVVALIVTGAAIKLFRDSAKVPYLGYVAAAMALGLFTYALVQGLKGRRHMADELERFASLEALRRALHLDDPSQLLPR